MAKHSTPASKTEDSDEELHRKWNELLQEMRVMQTGAQILAAFLVVLPFQSRFDTLEVPDERFYLVLLVASALVILLLVTPVAVHRHFFGQQLKATTVHLGHIISRLVVLGVGVLVAGCVWFVVQVLHGWQMGLLVGGILMAAALFLLLVLPRIVTPRSTLPAE
ncbi:hypothetical protein BLJ79_08170 [Arthrobacter sp. UCD-GKA]|uniref:DUF6328 family protein n=1 Tax=Arthrobacter sp. UCD-GKA TaxID=1913576 RepID=UPI0008DE8C6F|nr:DUF6328 family protein [Arthrobacter sp. UCD-GKA]OIH85153.1 hypothetical protein BLJ79_08170 [Arthrobacter sp. UCD-GKA]